MITANSLEVENRKLLAISHKYYAHARDTQNFSAPMAPLYYFHLHPSIVYVSLRSDLGRKRRS